MQCGVLFEHAFVFLLSRIDFDILFDLFVYADIEGERVRVQGLPQGRADFDLVLFQHVGLYRVADREFDRMSFALYMRVFKDVVFTRRLTLKTVGVGVPNGRQA